MDIAKGSFATLVLRGSDLLHNNPVPAFWRNIERLRRLLDGFLLVGSFDCAEMFSTLADDVYAPALPRIAGGRSWLILRPESAHGAL
jgi:hypothetical protein